MLSVRNVTTEYRVRRGVPVRAARDISFEVGKGKLFTLLGPSGCGKTTTLRSIAGLERPVSGEIEAAGRIVFSAQRNIFVALNRRNFGMVFQSYAIWPHMTVLQNASFPLEVGGGLSRRVIRDRAMRVLDAVALAELAGRDATKLSGGQQQRLALARALVMEPDLLLLDEPLSNLDARLRERMRMELKRIQRELSVTTVYVTHDQSEALALSHEIAVMNDGRIVQTGSPEEIYEKPCDRFVAEFIGSSNFVDAEVLGSDPRSGFWRVRSKLGAFMGVSDRQFSAGEKVTISIRPENVEIVDALAGDALNLFQARVEAKIFQGDFSDFELRVGDVLLSARAHSSRRAPEGGAAMVRIAPEHCVLIGTDAPSGTTA